MLGDKTEASRKVKEYMEEIRVAPERIRFYACAHCGTLATTDSRKAYAADQDVDWEQFEYGGEHEGIAGEDYSVRMTPPCPCGEDIFNPVFVQGYTLKP